MNIRVYSSGRLNMLTDRLYSDAFRFNTKIFWLADCKRQYLRSPGRTGNCYLDIGYRIRVKPYHLYIMPAISCYEIISDENMITNLFYLYVDLYPEIRSNILEIDLTNSYRCQTLYQTLADLIDEVPEIITPIAVSLLSCPEIRWQLDFGKNPNILRVVDYINQNYHMQISNTALASIANYSLNYFMTFDSGFPTAHRSSKKLSQK